MAKSKTPPAGGELPEPNGAGGERYAWRSDSPLGGDAQAVGEELNRIQNRDGGVTAKAVVDEARPEASPLHRYFEWDDSVASEKYREIQGGRVIRNIRVVRTGDEGEPVRHIAYLSVTRSDTGSRAYLPTARVMSEADLRRQAIGEAHAQLAAWRRRFAYLSQYDTVIDEVVSAVADAAGG